MFVMVMVVIVANSVLICTVFNTARWSLSGPGCATLHRDERLEWCRLCNTAQGSALVALRRVGRVLQVVQHCSSVHCRGQSQSLI